MENFKYSVKHESPSSWLYNNAFNIIIVVGVLYLLLVLYNIVGVSKHCKGNSIGQIVLILSIPIYALVYPFIRKNVCHHAR